MKLLKFLPGLFLAVSLFGQDALPPSVAGATGAASNDLSGNYPGPTVAKVNGTTVPTNSSANQIPLTTAAATTVWTGVPVCLDSAGQHLNFNTTTHVFSCGTSSNSTPGSPDHSVQTNQSGVFTGDANFTYQSGVLNLGQLDPTWLGQMLLKVKTTDLVVGGEVLVGQQDSGDSTGFQLGYHAAYNAGSGTVTALKDTYSDLENFGGGTVSQMLSHYAFGANDAGSHTNDFIGHYSLFDNNNSSQLDRYYGFYNGGIHNHAGSTVGNAFGFWSDDIAGNATNPYYSWFDSQGVRRVKEDNTFNSVGQAIEALYNPQFTKYTPGAANFERVILGQWNGNVAEIGNQAGGTGTLRALKLIGSTVLLPSGSTAVGTTDTQTITNKSIDAGQLTGTVLAARFPSNQTIRQIQATFDGQGSALSGTTTRCTLVSYGGTIQSATVTADVSGSATIDVKTVAYSSYTGPASASSITASAIPAISSAVKSQDSTLIGWTTTVTANTQFCFVLSGPATVTWVQATLKVAAN